MLGFWLVPHGNVRDGLYASLTAARGPSFDLFHSVAEARSVE